MSILIGSYEKIAIAPSEIKKLTAKPAYDAKKWMILVSIRNRLNLSVFEAAQILCVSTAAYLQWENGGSFPNSVIKLFCVETGLPISDYMSHTAFDAAGHAESFAKRSFLENHPTVEYFPLYMRKPSEIAKFCKNYPDLKITLAHRSLPEGTNFEGLLEDQIVQSNI